MLIASRLVSHEFSEHKALVRSLALTLLLLICSVAQIWIRSICCSHQSPRCSPKSGRRAFQMTTSSSRTLAPSSAVDDSRRFRNQGVGHQVVLRIFSKRWQSGGSLLADSGLGRGVGAYPGIRLDRFDQKSYLLQAQQKWQNFSASLGFVRVGCSICVSVFTTKVHLYFWDIYPRL